MINGKEVLLKVKSIFKRKKDVIGKLIIKKYKWFAKIILILDLRNGWANYKRLKKQMSLNMMNNNKKLI